MASRRQNHASNKLRSIVQRPIPATSEKRYISGNAALNLPAPEGTSGDWHFFATFMMFADKQPPDQIFLAGEGTKVNTNRVFGSYGVYECTQALSKLGLRTAWSKNFSANHHRAILDLLYDRIVTYGNPVGLEGATEDWLDSDEQKEFLLSKALDMLPHLNDAQQAELRRWVENERRAGYRS